MSGSGESSGGSFSNPVEKFEEAFMSCLSALTKEDTLTNVDKDEIRADVEQGIFHVLESARTVESYFLKKRLEIAAQKPELQLKDDINDLKLEVMRKDELLKKNYDKINHWQNILSDVTTSKQTGGLGGNQLTNLQGNQPGLSHGQMSQGQMPQGQMSQGPMSVGGPMSQGSMSVGGPMSQGPMSVGPGPMSQGPMSVGPGPMSQGGPMSVGPHTPMSQGPMTPTGGGRPNTPGSGRPQTPGNMGGQRMQNTNIGFSPSMHQQSIGSPQLGQGHGMGHGLGFGRRGGRIVSKDSDSSEGSDTVTSTTSTFFDQYYQCPVTVSASNTISNQPKVGKSRKPRAKKPENEKTETKSRQRSAMVKAQIAFKLKAKKEG